MIPICTALWIKNNINISLLLVNKIAVQIKEPASFHETVPLFLDQGVHQRSFSGLYKDKLYFYH